MDGTARFKTEEDIVKAFLDAGYVRDDPVDPDNRIFLKKEVVLEEDRKDDVKVIIWKVPGYPVVNLSFPLVKKRNSEKCYERKDVLLTYSRNENGLALKNVEYKINGRMIFSFF